MTQLIPIKGFVMNFETRDSLMCREVNANFHKYVRIHLCKVLMTININTAFNEIEAMKLTTFDQTSKQNNY